jgi:hypothetical protein
MSQRAVRDQVPNARKKVAREVLVADRSGTKRKGTVVNGATLAAKTS